jgi:cobalamin biosynthesis Mg chelatase CobN
MRWWMFRIVGTGGGPDWTSASVFCIFSCWRRSAQYEQYEQREQPKQYEQYEQYEQREQPKQPEQYKQSEQREQYKQTEQPEQREQYKQTEQPEQREQPEQSEQSEQSEQREQSEQYKQFTQSRQCLRLLSAASAASREPKYSTEQRFLRPSTSHSMPSIVAVVIFFLAILIVLLGMGFCEGEGGSDSFAKRR